MLLTEFNEFGLFHVCLWHRDPLSIKKRAELYHCLGGVVHSDENFLCMNAKCVPPDIIHSIVKLQALWRNFLFRRRFILKLPHIGCPARPSLALALYLSRRLRNGQYMDVDQEIGFIGNWLRSFTEPRLDLLESLLGYCARYDLRDEIGCVLIQERLNSAIVSIQQTLFANVQSTLNLNESSRLISDVEYNLPASLHKYVRFARYVLEEKSLELENTFKDKLSRCVTVQDFAELAQVARRALLPGSIIHDRIAKCISQRQECIRFEILTMYDHPVADGCIPELEAVALEYSRELPADDPVLRDFALGICFLFLKMRREIKRSLDIRSELTSFTWCKKIGAEHVIPIMGSNLTPSELKSIIPILVEHIRPRVDPDGCTAHKVFQSQLFRIRKLVNFDISDELPAGTDYGNIWDLFPPDFVLAGSYQAIEPEQAETDIGKPEPLPIDGTTPQTEDPAPKLPGRLCLNHQLSQIPYTPFGHRLPVSQTPACTTNKYVVTRFPSRCTVPRPLVPHSMLADRTVSDKEGTCT